MNIFEALRDLDRPENMQTLLREVIERQIGYTPFTTDEATAAWETERKRWTRYGYKMINGTEMPKRSYASIRAGIQQLTKFAPQCRTPDPHFYEYGVLRTGATLYHILPSVGRKLNMTGVGRDETDPKTRSVIFNLPRAA